MFLYVSSSFPSITPFLRFSFVGRPASSSGVPALLRGQYKHCGGLRQEGHIWSQVGRKLSRDKKILRGSVRQVSPGSGRFQSWFLLWGSSFSWRKLRSCTESQKAYRSRIFSFCFKTSHELREVLVRSSAITVSCSYCHSSSAALPLCNRASTPAFFGQYMRAFIIPSGTRRHRVSPTSRLLGTFALRHPRRHRELRGCYQAAFTYHESNLPEKVFWV